MERRRIAIKSIGKSLPDTPLACASLAPVTARPFCFAGGPTLKLCCSLERYTDNETMETLMNGVILSVMAYDECIQFYRYKIGLKTLMEKPGIISFQFGSMYLQIEDGEKFKLIPTEGVILRENVASISEKQQELLKNGISLEIHDLEWGKIGFVYDPHGNKVEYFRGK
jgi:hypothetical protein